MDTRVVLILVGNCCVMPTIAFALGVAWARGWLRSPVNISRDRETAPAAPNEWNGYGGENE